MPKHLRKLVELLDGTPAEYGRRQRGQSLVELALVMPILIILIAGLVEIGWFANNYLTLLDVSRSGARRGTVLQDSFSPLQWNDRASHVPSAWVSNADMRTTPADPADEDIRIAYRWCPTIGDDVGFYNEVACLMIRSMEPLPFRDGGLNVNTGNTRPADNDVDDIVVSAFALELVRRPFLSANAADRPLPTAGDTVQQAVVVGRYPTNANECEVDQDGAGFRFDPDARDSRDPFDYNNNNSWDHSGDTVIPGFPAGSQTIRRNFNELEGMDLPGSNVGNAEKQIGFVWRGNHVIEGTGCLGSEWTIREIEQLVNLPNYRIPETDLSGGEDEPSMRSVVPNQGIIMVELFWQHQLLLQIPVFSPVFDILGPRTTISVWAAFPLPTVEPFIQIPPAPAVPN